MNDDSESKWQQGFKPYPLDVVVNIYSIMRITWGDKGIVIVNDW
jgi:hypothetical protein